MQFNALKIRNLILLILYITFINLTITSFKTDQLKNSRVKTAYKEKGDIVKLNLKSNNIAIDKLKIYLRVFKLNKIIELWAKNRNDKKYKLIKTFDICALSGSVGPKRQMGDGQVPEGFYYIDRFNPWSNFYLSLGINYPNKSDKILGVKGKLGGDIFIHGNCVTIGCMPITDDKIKELYIYCVEAKNNGQTKIPVTIFPEKLNNNNFNKLKLKYHSDNDKINLWTDLKKAYDLFEKQKILPKIVFLNNGKHSIN